MSKDANPLAPLGKAREEEWVRRHEAEVLENLRKKGKKPGDKTTATPADDKPAEKK